MKLPTAWLVPAATAVWAVWTWAHEQSLEREKERERMTALYVNPFLSACEDLQSRIYKLLELGGLSSLRDRYSDGAYADETLYLIVRLFGWMAAVNRYGPYTQDPVVIKYSAAIRRAFATSREGCPVGPFNFFAAEQKALGKIVMHSVEGEYGAEMDTISYYEFREVVRSPHRMPPSEAVTQTLEAMRAVQNIEDLDGTQRLAEVQNHLVDLLEYLEEKEGYRLFVGQRMKCKLLCPEDAPSVTRKARRARA